MTSFDVLSGILPSCPSRVVAGMMVTLCGVLIVSLESTESEGGGEGGGGGGGGAEVGSGGDDILIEEVELTAAPDGVLSTRRSVLSSDSAQPLETDVVGGGVGVLATLSVPGALDSAAPLGTGVGVEDGGVGASQTSSAEAVAAAKKRRMTWGYLAAAVNVSLDTW